jgi:hypothetical protein
MSDWVFSGLTPQYNLRNGQLPWTRAVDSDQNDLRALLCGRRTGKTSYLAIKLVMDGIPGEVHPFVAATQQKAKEILFPILQRFERSHGLKLDWTGSAQGRVATDRGVKIRCMGLSTKPEVEKLRGERYPGVIFDECGAMNQDLLKTAIFEAAEPATADFSGRGGFGIICSGTPSYAPVGLWHDICGGNEGVPAHGFTVHRANITHNPYIRDAAAYLARKLEQKKWTIETPEYVREWLGKFALSSDGLCYGKAWNGVVEHRVLRPLVGTTIIALDFGESSPCAWSVVRCVMHTEQIGNMIHQFMHVHVLEVIRKVCTSLAEIAAITRQLQKTYSAGYLVGDSAEGFGIRQLKDQYGLNFEKSEKSGLKAERIFMMQGMLRTGTLRIYEDCSDLIDEISTVPWNEDRDDHHQAYSDHCCDSLHYAIEKAMMIHRVKPAEPAVGSPEYFEAKRLEQRRKNLAPKKPAHR